MSTQFERNLTFTTKYLGHDATLLLTFDKPVDGLYKDRFPVIWRRITFGRQEAIFTSLVTYESQLAITKAQVSDRGRVIVGAAATAFIDMGQSTTLTKDSQGLYDFTDPEEGRQGYATVVNGTSEKEDMAIGFLTGNTIGMPTPVLYFPDIKPSATVQTQFVPILRAYVTTLAFQEKQVIHSEFISQCVWEQDLTELAASTKWELTFDPPTGEYAIVRME